MRIFLAAWLTLAAPVLNAEPVPESERIPVDVRRTTLIVRDIDKSLPLYRDALGLNVVYDERLGGGKQPDGSVKPPTTRLVLMRANDTFIGALGLMQRLDDPNPAPPENKRPMAGDSIVVINAKDLDQRWPQVKAVSGVTVHTEPTRIEYPGPGGKGVIPVMFSAVYDPDGFFIEINQILGAPAGTQSADRDPDQKEAD
jgi:catechol 2,3-dioxygenase-like lactoylglutathione lyase family enzyme